MRHKVNLYLKVIIFTILFFFPMPFSHGDDISSCKFNIPDFLNHFNRNNEDALLFLNSMSEIGESECQESLYYVYYMGLLGVKEDHYYAVEFLMMAAESGDASAQFHLSMELSLKDKERSDYWYQKSAENGYALSQFLLGMRHESKTEYKEALYWYELASEQNHEESKEMLALLRELLSRPPEISYSYESIGDECRESVYGKIVFPDIPTSNDECTPLHALIDEDESIPLTIFGIIRSDKYLPLLVQVWRINKIKKRTMRYIFKDRVNECQRGVNDNLIIGRSGISIPTKSDRIFSNCRYGKEFIVHWRWDDFMLCLGGEEERINANGQTKTELRSQSRKRIFSEYEIGKKKICGG